MSEKRHPFFFNTCYSDFERYKAEAVRWNIDFKKMNKGSFLASIAMMDFEFIQVAKTYLNGTMIQQGLTPVGYRTFAIPADKNQRFTWLNRKIDSNQILVFPNNNTIDGLSSDAFHVYTISIEYNYLNTFLETNQYRNLEKALSNDEVAFNADSNYLHYIRSYLEVLFSKANEFPHIIYSEGFKRGVLSRLPKLIFEYIEEGKPLPSVNQVKKSEIILKKAVDYIELKHSDKFSVAAMCKDLNVSERTLEYAFKQKYSIGPKRFSKALRLNKIRDELLKADEKVLLSDIAGKYGFTHMSQFSVDYKELFGELPSETLNQQV